MVHCVMIPDPTPLLEQGEFGGSVTKAQLWARWIQRTLEVQTDTRDQLLLVGTRRRGNISTCLTLNPGMGSGTQTPLDHPDQEAQGGP